MEKNNILLHLQEEYKNSIEEKLRNIKALIDEMRQDVPFDKLKALRTDIHKMAGSAGLYGFMAVSDICKRFDADLLEKINNFKDSQDNKAWAKEFESYLDEIRKAFSKGQDFA